MARPQHPVHDPTKPAPAIYHYLFALVITGIVTGISFFIKDAPAMWITFGVAVAMDIGIVLAAALDALHSPRR